MILYLKPLLFLRKPDANKWLHDTAQVILDVNYVKHAVFILTLLLSYL